MLTKLPYQVRGSFGLKIVSAFIGVIVIILSTFTGYAVFQEREKTKQNLREQGEMLAILLADHSTLGVFAENRALLKESVDNVMALKDVSSVSVHTAGKKPLYSKEKKAGSGLSETDLEETLENAGRDPLSTAIREGHDFFEFVRPVLIKRLSPRDETLYFGHESTPASMKVIGYVRIILSKDSYRKEIVSILYRNGIIMLVFIVSSIGIVNLAVKKVTRPLKKLTDNVMALGKGMPVEETTVESRDEIGNLASAFSDMVIARGQAEKLLRESEKKFRMLAETAAAAIFIYRGESFYYFNSTTEKLTGYSREELLSMDFWAIVHPDFQPLIKDLAAGKGQDAPEPFRCEFKIMTKTGDERWVDCTFGAIEFEGKPAALGTAYDLTPHKKLEAQFIQARKMEAVGVLAGELAHDFNNFISAIISYVHMAKTRTADGDPHRYIDLILACSERAASLTKGLLAFSRKQTTSPRPVRVNEIIASIDKLLSPVIGEAIELKTACAEQDMLILADAGQIEQVLMNLATNARDAMPAGGSLSVATEQVELDEEFIQTNGYGARGKYALITVTDTGTGMDKVTQDRIFEPFFTTKELGKGTGLGLSIVYGTVKQHGGYIMVSSHPGAGTSFKVYFPVIQASPAAEPTPPVSLRGTETILLAEDDEVLRNLTMTLLADSGYSVIGAADGEQALKKFRERRNEINLVILDVIMPQKNGQEVWSEIQKIRPDVAVLFVTGCTSNLPGTETLPGEDFNVLTKPIQPASLLKTIRTVLDEALPA